MATEVIVGVKDALEKFYAYTGSPEVVKGYSSVSITFTESWTGEEQQYVIDTMLDNIQPRIFSLETGHVITDIKFAKTFTEATLTRVVERCTEEFTRAHEELVGAIMAHDKDKELEESKDNGYEAPVEIPEDITPVVEEMNPEDVIIEVPE